MAEHRPDEDMPAWARDPLAAAVLFGVVLYAVVMLVDQDARERFVGASQAVGALGLVVALVVALRQLEHQRTQLEEQRRTAKAEAALQRQTVAEQRRAVELGRLADLRRGYARLLAAAHDVALSTMPQREVLHGPGVVRAPRAPRPPIHEGVWPEFQRAVLQLEMQDRSPQRSDVVRELWPCLLEQADAAQLAMDIRAAMHRLQRLGESLGGSIEDARIRANDVTISLLGRNEAFARTVAQHLTEVEMVMVRRDAIGFARFALGASIAAEEAGTAQQAPA